MLKMEAQLSPFFHWPTLESPFTDEFFKLLHEQKAPSATHISRTFLLLLPLWGCSLMVVLWDYSWALSMGVLPKRVSSSTQHEAILGNSSHGVKVTWSTKTCKMLGLYHPDGYFYSSKEATQDMIRMTASGISLLFQSWPCHLIMMLLWVVDFIISLCLSFLICKMEMSISKHSCGDSRG